MTEVKNIELTDAQKAMPLSEFMGTNDPYDCADDDDADYSDDADDDE